MDHCDTCGFTYADLDIADASAALHRYVAEYGDRMTGAPVERLRTRPTPEVWSPLEYTCHLRDVLVVQRGRIEQTLVEDLPTYVPMGRDERVVTDRYNEQDPARVAAELIGAAAAFGATVDALAPAELARTGIYNYPAPAERDLQWLTRHTVHEARHHLDDVDAGLR